MLGFEPSCGRTMIKAARNSASARPSSSAAVPPILCSHLVGEADSDSFSRETICALIIVISFSGNLMSGDYHARRPTVMRRRSRVVGTICPKLTWYYHPLHLENQHAA